MAAAINNISGKKSLIERTNNVPNIAASGSTIALSAPIKYALNLFIPVVARGILIAAPSGRF